MSLSIDCDQVFDVLTRGPFPSGLPSAASSDAQVEAHLACCHDCRALAEALRPAVELFHEAIAPAADDELPGYHGRLEPGAKCLAQRVAAAIEAEQPPSVLAQSRVAPARRWEASAQRALQAVMALACGILLAVAWWNVSFNGQNVAARPAPIRLSSEGLVQLASLQLPASCLPQVASPSLALQCCTECHSATAGGPRLTSPSLALLANNCRACHP